MDRKLDRNMILTENDKWSALAWRFANLCGRESVRSAARTLQVSLLDRLIIDMHEHIDMHMHTCTHEHIHMQLLSVGWLAFTAWVLWLKAPMEEARIVPASPSCCSLMRRGEQGVGTARSGSSSHQGWAVLHMLCWIKGFLNIPHGDP